MICHACARTNLLIVFHRSSPYCLCCETNEIPAQYHLANETSKAVTVSRKWQSRTQRSSRSQNGAPLTFWLKVFVQNSTLRGVVYTKSVKRNETKRNEMNIVMYWKEYIQCHNSPIPLCDNLNKECRLKSSQHRVVHTKTAKESEEISCISLQSSRRSFREIQIFKFAYSALPLFYSLFIG